MYERVNEALEQGNDLLSSLLDKHRYEIQAAFMKLSAEKKQDKDSKEKLKINLSIELEPLGRHIGVATGISFVESKVKDSAAVMVSDQPDLPGMREEGQPNV